MAHARRAAHFSYTHLEQPFLLQNLSITYGLPPLKNFASFGLRETNAVFHWQIFTANLSKSVNSIGGFLNGPIEMTDFCRFVAKIFQWKTA